MNKGQWALTLEIVRHVEPFLGLPLDELKLLEGFHNASIRRQSFSGSLSASDLEAFTPESYDHKYPLQEPFGRSISCGKVYPIRVCPT